MDAHDSHCSVWDWHYAGDKTLNNSKPCTCGYRAYQERLRRIALSRRHLRPLGMSDEDFLRTLGIKPE